MLFSLSEQQQEQQQQKQQQQQPLSTPQWLQSIATSVVHPIASTLSYLLTSISEASSAMLTPNSRGCVRGYIMNYFITVSLGLAVGALGGFHAYLTATGQSSIEFYKNKAAARESGARGEEEGSLGGEGDKRGGRGWLSYIFCCPYRCCCKQPPRPQQQQQQRESHRRKSHVFDAGSARVNFRAVFRTPFLSGAWLLPPTLVGLGMFGVGGGMRKGVWSCLVHRRWWCCLRAQRGCGGKRKMGGGSHPLTPSSSDDAGADFLVVREREGEGGIIRRL